MKILHTSDLHLGKNLSEESFYDDQKYILDEITNIVNEKDNKTNEELNEEVLVFLIEKQVISKDSARRLVDQNKVHINDISRLD